MTICRYKRSRFWAVYEAEDRLVCVCVYKRGALEVVRRLGGGAGGDGASPSVPPSPAPPGSASDAGSRPMGGRAHWTR